MIVRMRRLTLLAPAAARDALLEGLQKLGCVEIDSSEERDSAAIAATAEASRRYARARTALLRAVRDFSGDASKVRGTRLSPNPKKSLEQVELTLEAYDKARARADALAREIAAREPWGDFDPARLAALAERGWPARLLRAPEKKADEALAEIESSGAAVAEVGRRDGSRLWLALGFSGDLPAGVEESPLPDRPLSALREEAAAAEAERDELYEKLVAFSSDTASLDKGWATSENEGRLAAAALELGSELDGRLATLTGWFPADSSAELESFLKAQKCWYEVREPAPDEEPPVRLRNGAVTSLFEPVARLHSLPRYRELDTVPFFSMFFAFFVGCCLADAAYGAIVLALALVARALAGRAIKPLMTLLAILGGVTVVCGVALNSVFGEAVFGEGGSWFTPLAPAGGVYPMMSLALVVGFVQILLAMGLRSYVSVRERGWKHGVEPASFILLTLGLLVWAANESALQGSLLGLQIHEFNVNGLAVGAALASVPQQVGLGLLAAGTLGILLFANIGAAPAMRYSVLFFWSMYNYCTKIISDALSYLRVFALGLAGGLLAASFNKIAFMLIEHDGVRDYASPLIVATILILVVGHALNLVLSLVSAFVHPLRLTFVEFYTNLDYQGGGRPFRPLARVENDNR